LSATADRIEYQINKEQFERQNQHTVLQEHELLVVFDISMSNYRTVKINANWKTFLAKTTFKTVFLAICWTRELYRRKRLQGAPLLKNCFVSCLLASSGRVRSGRGMLVAAAKPKDVAIIEASKCMGHGRYLRQGNQLLHLRLLRQG
jgi:hypothetical protein